MQLSKLELRKQTANHHRHDSWVCGTLSAAGESSFQSVSPGVFRQNDRNEDENWATSNVSIPMISLACRLVEALDRNRAAYDLELRQRRADGVYRWFNLGLCPRETRRAVSPAGIMLLTDIDDRKRAEDPSG